MAKIAEQNREMLTKMNQGKDIAAVTAATMKGFVPETLAGMKRTSISAEQNQAMGINMTHAEAQFEGENSASLDVSITDVGNMSGPMKMGMVGWTMATVQPGNRQRLREDRHLQRLQGHGGIQHRR